jgi:hypothetical protein
MRVPQVSERIKEAPAQALRGVFAGIGQLLLITDKLRNKAPFGQQVPYAHAPEAAPVAASRTAPAEPVPDPAPPKSPAASEIRDFDKTGNVRLITGDEPPAAQEPAPSTAQEPAPSTAQEPTPSTAQEPAPSTAEEPVPVAAEETADSAPPLPNYDELSIASLRARLRNLDVTQVRALVEYEKAHAGRADVIVMFERRIAKLEAGD